MNVSVIKECGYDEAMLGISLSWASDVERSIQIAPNLAHKQCGHNKFLENIYVWLDCDLPRYMWQECNTYRVGTSKQSESTMHTISKRLLEESDFDGYVYPETLRNLNNDILIYQQGKQKDVFMRIKNNLPESFLQRRIWCLNYKTLQNIFWQRINHKLPQWKIFLSIVLSELEHPEFIIRKEE